MARLLISMILMGLMLEQVFSDVVTNQQNVVTTNPDPEMKNFVNTFLNTANQMAAVGPKPRSSWTSLIVRSVVPLVDYVMSFSGKGAVLFGQTLVVLFVGFMITIGICTMTPYCMINWDSLGITNSRSQNNANNFVGFLTSRDALEMLTTAISEAIEQSRGTIQYNNVPYYNPQQQQQLLLQQQLQQQQLQQQQQQQQYYYYNNNNNNNNNPNQQNYYNPNTDNRTNNP